MRLSEKLQDLLEQLDALTSEQRGELLTYFCSSCHDPQYRKGEVRGCQCWNDE